MFYIVHINTLNINNKRITNKDDIIKAEVKYYQELYTNNNNINSNDTHEYINNTVFENILNENNAKKCEGLLTLDELTDAVNTIKLDK